MKDYSYQEEPKITNPLHWLKNGRKKKKKKKKVVFFFEKRWHTTEKKKKKKTHFHVTSVLLNSQLSETNLRNSKVKTFIFLSTHFYYFLHGILNLRENKTTLTTVL